MAQKIIETTDSNGKLHLSNILDINTGKLVTYKQTSNVSSDADCDGFIYRKFKGNFIERNIERGLDVSIFGAKGDGVADDSSAFINALAFLKKQRTRFYAFNPTKTLKLFIPGGKYLMSQTIQIPKGISLSGESANESVLLTVNRVLPFIEIPIEVNEPTPNGLHGAFTVIENLSVYGYHYNRNVYEAKLTPNATNHGINVLRSRTRIRNCNVAGFEGGNVNYEAVYYNSITSSIIYAGTRGIKMKGVSTSLSCVDVEIRACSTAISADSTYSCYFTNCLIESNDANFLPQSDDGATISMLNVKGVAIALQNCKNFVFSSCYFENHAVTSVYYSSSQNIIQNSIIVPGTAWTGLNGVPLYKLGFQTHTPNESEGNKWINNYYDTNGLSPYVFTGATKSTIIEVNTKKQFDDIVALATSNTVLHTTDRKMYFNKRVCRTDQPKTYTSETVAAAETTLINWDMIFDSTLRRFKYFDGATWTIYGQEKPLSGTTAQRPQSLQFLYTNAIFFDTTINRPIFWSGTAWVDILDTAIDTATTAYNKATLNTAYPNAKVGFKVIADAAGFTYTKKDNSATGNWSVRASSQLA